MNWLVFVFCISVVYAFPEENNYDPDNQLFGGDMMLTSDQWERVMNGGDILGTYSAYAAMKNSSVLWLPNNKTVPYSVAQELESDPEATLGIMLALREWEERSCLKFKRRTIEEDFIHFFKQSGCWSYVGRIGGQQNISLGDGCFDMGTIVHEIGHAVGFGHEQNRPDRDDYITIRWENIPEVKKHNFVKYTNLRVDSLNSTYDYKSFMQYSKTAFGINDSVTLDPKKPDIFQLGQRLGFTAEDQDQAMKLYRCNGETTRTPESPKIYIPAGDDICTFEDGMCHYTDDNDDNFDWMRAYGGTPSFGTGPDTDHTTGRMGTFIFIEASSPTKQGYVARLSSKVFYDTSPQCLTFFFHMFSQYKNMMGNFNVYLREGQTLRKIFHKSGSQENEWLEAKIDFNSTVPYQVVFEGIRGSGYQGDISLDDISITHGACANVDPFNLTMNAEQAGVCEDVDDRERQYCNQWKTAGYCEVYKKEMWKFCRETCNFC